MMTSTAQSYTRQKGRHFLSRTLIEDGRNFSFRKHYPGIALSHLFHTNIHNKMRSFQGRVTKYL